MESLGKTKKAIFGSHQQKYKRSFSIHSLQILIQSFSLVFLSYTVFDKGNKSEKIKQCLSAGGGTPQKRNHKSDKRQQPSGALNFFAYCFCIKTGQKLTKTHHKRQS